MPAYVRLQAMLSDLGLSLNKSALPAAVRYAAPLTGAGAPTVAAPVGTLYLRTDGGAATTLYVKESGTGPAGWVTK